MKGEVAKFYYLRDEQNHPIVTVCVLKNESYDNKFSRGVSICSTKDFISKKEGRSRALGPARKALYTRKSSEPILREEAIIQLSKVSDSDYLLFRSEYNPTLTDFEKQLLKV